MEAGLQVINDSGFLQIDSKFSNYSFAQKLVLTPNTPSDGNLYGCDLMVDGDAMVFAEIQESTYVGLSYFTRQSSTTRKLRLSFVASAGVTLPVYIFRRMAPTSNTYGIEVYGSAGQLVFTGPNVKYLKIFKAYQRSSTAVDPFPPEQWPAGKKYAVMIGRVSGDLSVTTEDMGSYYDRYEIRNTWHFGMFSGITRIDLTQCFNWLSRGSVPEFITHTNGSLSALVADVTGL